MVDKNTNSDINILDTIITNTQESSTNDTEEELALSSVVQNQFKTYSIIGALLSVAVYSLFNIISDSATYLAYYFTTGIFQIERVQILTYIINIALFLFTIILLMTYSSMDKKKFFRFSSIIFGLLIGGLIFLTKKKGSNILLLNENEFSFFFLIYTIPYLLYYLSLLNNIHEQTWLFDYALFFLGLCTILILTSIKDIAMAWIYAKENILFVVIWGIIILLEAIYMFLIKHEHIVKLIEQKIKKDQSNIFTVYHN